MTSSDDQDKEDRRQALCGLFWLLQHDQRDLKARAAQQAALTELSSKHAFYFDHHTKLYDAEEFRSLAARVAKKLDLTWGGNGMDRVDKLFRLGLEGVPQQMQKTYGYDSNTFSETDLPAPAAQPEFSAKQRDENGVFRNPHEQRAFYIVLCDIDAVRRERLHADYKFRAKPQILQALELLIALYDLRHGPLPTHAPQQYTSAELSSVVDKLCKNHPPREKSKHLRSREVKGRMHPIGNRSVWHVGTNIVPVTYLAKLRQSAEHVEKQSGVLHYSPRTAVALSHQVTIQLLDSSRAGRTSAGAADVTMPPNSGSS
ncbi:hypothetical protein LTS10_002617 [Elasticomyces elasticus]|nr:hypothetical protein LTS10_002617 [Elasticomyces elasticus]